MAFWKGKKKRKTDHLKQLCPNCLNSNLRYASSFGGIYGPAMLICPDCGYKGPIYVDVDGTDDKEDLQMKLLREEFADDLEENKTAQELAQMCLEEKWTPHQANNNSPLRAWCPFCADVSVVCSICKCPPEICSDQATGGLIGKLNEMYDDEIPLCEVDPEIYQEIVIRFQKILENPEG
jgi:hypothetical protein